jgi:apolipoprotein D and lipocalin family protein
MSAKKIIAFLLIVFTFLGCNMKKAVNTETVQNFELKRYLGKWYEIARFPNKFEKDLVGVTATYSKCDDGKIEVLNAGYKNSLDGELKEAKGKAKILNPENPSSLKVSFFWFFYADYFVLELDTVGYNYALVGSSTDDYLWILSRTPQMDKTVYNQLVEKAKSRGYDVSKLYLVPQ